LISKGCQRATATTYGPSGTWTSTETGIAVVTGAAAIPVGDIDFISITSADPNDLVLRTN